MLEALGMLLGVLDATSATSTAFSTISMASSAAAAGYDYLHASAVQKAAEKVWRKSAEIRKYAKNEAELCSLINDGDNYAHQSFHYSKERCEQLHIAHKEYTVTWNDRELGEFVRLGRIVAAGTHKHGAYHQVRELLRIGQARYILMTELMFNQED